MGAEADTSKGGSQSRRRAKNLPYLALEDGFLRSIGLGETGAASLSLIVDDIGVYYDATRPSRLERLIETADDWCDAAMHARARGPDRPDRRLGPVQDQYGRAAGPRRS